MQLWSFVVGFVAGFISGVVVLSLVAVGSVHGRRRRGHHGPRQVN